ncbi:uncharacterized protein C8R40DRAFT_1177452 [Lentinula edodes]|uniref:uncharacterized protein n=1 Tax=Lentinula edodes TaxID=5353 RepID=UPI001E8D7F73|nr:uncharacterized protein C8R40DRAFT_1177452 [Lentinula edodes]KAH7868711.1 hypothetical protein C8R40DRAFT_1177452 [Lentinula edodes]
MDYVNMIFAHRPDPTVMMEEIVRAFNYEIEKGWVLYWVTSEWPAWEIEDAFHVVDKLNLLSGTNTSMTSSSPPSPILTELKLP